MKTPFRMNLDMKGGCALLACLFATLTACSGSYGPTAEARELDGEFTAIAAAHDHTCALTTAGGVMCWGSSTMGSLGLGEPTANGGIPPTLVPGLESGVVAISTGATNSCALTSDGRAQCWGRNDSGSFGIGSDETQYRPLTLPLPSPAMAISTHSNTTCAVAKDGRLFCAGSRAGIRSDYQQRQFVEVATDVSAVSVGHEHKCLLKRDGNIHCWGSNSHGQLGIDGAIDYYDGRDTPNPVVGLAGKASAIAVGSDHSCALVNGGVQCWGRNDEGQLGNGSNSGSASPVAVTGLQGEVIAVSSGGYATCAVLRNGKATCWGKNGHVNYGNTPAILPGIRGATAISVGAQHTCVLAGKSRARCWGTNGVGQLGWKD